METSIEVIDGKVYYVQTFDADIEEPECNRCDNVCTHQKICDNCAPWWANYRRTVMTEITDLEK